MDRSRICRFCAEFRTTEQLTPLDDRRRRIRTKLFRCSQINLSVDEDCLLPQNVCDDCVDKLEQSWRFAEKVAKTQEELQGRLAEDPLAHIKVEDEYSVEPPHRHLTDLGAVIKHEDCNLINSPIRMANEDVDPIYVAQPDSANMFVENPFTSPQTEVIEEEMLTDDAVDNAMDSNDEQQDINQLPTSSKQIRPPARRDPHLTLILPETFNDCKKEFWIKAMEVFRKTLNITDEDCNKDGTINEQTHPELLQHSWKTFGWKCFKCHEHFVDVDALRSHVEIQHSTTEMKYCCSDCNKEYELVASLKNHIYLKHRPVLRFCCDHCGRFYWCTNLLLKHQKAVYKKYNRHQLIQPTEAETDEIFRCFICAMKVRSKELLISHMRLCNLTKRMLCDYCDQDFGTSIEKKAHLFTAHTDIYKLKCEFCNERFKCQKHASNHKRKKHNYFSQTVMGILAADDAIDANDHTDANISIPKTCVICDTPISSSEQFHDHMKTHIDKDSYRCSFCGKRYKMLSMLKRHQRVHEELNRLQKSVPERCKICDEMLPNYAEFVIHMKIHVDGKSFKCNVCGKVFNNARYLKRHLACHSDEKKFECDICGRKVTSLNTMRGHMRIHSGETPFVCEFCGKKFRASGGLKMHRRIHTGIRPYTCEMCEPHHTFTRHGNYCIHMNRYHGIVIPKRLIGRFANVHK